MRNIFGRFAVLFGLCGLLVTGATSLAARQPERSLVVLMCDTPRAPLCGEMVQALSEAAPGSIIRINPNPPVAEAFEVNLMVSDDSAQLVWRPFKGADMDASASYDISKESTIYEVLAMARSMVNETPALAQALSQYSLR